MNGTALPVSNQQKKRLSNRYIVKKQIHELILVLILNLVRLTFCLMSYNIYYVNPAQLPTIPG